MKIFNKKQIFFIFFHLFCIVKTQVKISSNFTQVSQPEPSAILEISDMKRGVLIPRVALLNNKDQITVPTPKNGVTVYNTSTSKFNFWEAAQWNRNFEINDALPYISSTTNFSANSVTPVDIIGFPTSMKLFNLNNNTNGWTNLNVTVPIKPKKASNTVVIQGEGMVQLDNPNYANSFQFAIAIFVDNQLKIVRKYKFEDITACPWKKFEISGQFLDLTPNVVHDIKIYGINLPLTYTDYGYGTRLTYGGKASGCSNLNQDVAKIYLTAQLTE